MKQEEYEKRLRMLQSEFEDKKKALIAECAMSNNTLGIGQVAMDHVGSIRIEKIMTGTTIDKMPCCVYYGPELKKDLTPKANGGKSQIWQTNLKNK